MITRLKIIEILKSHSELFYKWNNDGKKEIIYSSEFDQIANEIMSELHKVIKPKKECLSELSRDGKHSPITTDPEGVYCGICGLDIK